MNCPKCDEPMERLESEPDVNVIGGWMCDDCQVFVSEWEAPEDDYEPVK